MFGRKHPPDSIAQRSQRHPKTRNFIDRNSEENPKSQ